MQGTLIDLVRERPADANLSCAAHALLHRRACVSVAGLHQRDCERLDVLSRLHVDTLSFVVGVFRRLALATRLPVRCLSFARVSGRGQRRNRRVRLMIGNESTMACTTITT